MPHCPYCGGKIKSDEIFCTQCGKKIPNDINDRIPNEKQNHRLWYFPIITIIIILIAIGSYYMHLENNSKESKELFRQGEDLALDGHYVKALSAFEDALERKGNFPAASTNKKFIKIAIEVTSELDTAEKLTSDEDFQKSLELIASAEDKLKNYNGEVVNALINEIVEQRKSTQLNQLSTKMNEDLSIDDLKTLLWEAEAIKNDESEIIAEDIKNRIISYIFSTASDQLNNKQFSSARDIVDDGLKYAPESEKLLSLKTTIEKEKTAFETAQEQRIEQAMNAAEEEHEINKNDAVEIIDIQVVEDDQDDLVVSGKLKSVATVPINSLSVEYVLLDKDDDEILSNEVYVYPDTLYPDEEGKFDFTHYEIEEETSELKVKIEKIKWFLD
ncbi:zinc ribbon domain-containing protein [Aquibacillus saliphilus]|uniref:zinc ribbon domain-containing protein n=1 Tax=Aquibacillus saliphilus TaxID=1909422 RepID=UPI001CEFB1F9|nr:zinc ribbon domain-containing protein [Aquibacillus saliphilus]